MALRVDDVYDADAEQEALAAIIDKRYRAMLGAIHVLVTEHLGLDPDTFRLRDQDTEALLKVAAEQVVRIDATTRAALQERLAEGTRLGLSNWEIANGSPKDGFAGIDQLFVETWRGRAETVARNESMQAAYSASLNRYQASGLKGHIVAYDGDQDAPCAAQNGKRFALDKPPVRQHVNCTLVPVFVVEAR